MQAMHMLHWVDMLQLSCSCNYYPACTALHKSTACSAAASHSGLSLHGLAQSALVSRKQGRHGEIRAS